MFQEIRDFGTVLQEPTGVDTISITTQPTELDDFYHEEIEVAPKETVTFITTDISLLFNQQRLMQASPMAIDRLVQNLKSSRPDSLKGVPDDQLAAAVKSRYIQSAADMQEYVRSVSMNMDDEIARIQSELIKQEPSSQDSSDSTE